MKKFNALSKAFVGTLLLLAAGSLRLAFAEPAFTTVDSTVVQISSSMQTGATRLLTASANSSFVELYVPATVGVSGEQIAMASSQSAVSTAATNGSFRIPVNTVFMLYDYKGSLWAIAVGTSPLNVSVLRKR